MRIMQMYGRVSFRMLSMYLWHILLIFKLLILVKVAVTFSVLQAA